MIRYYGTGIYIFDFLAFIYRGHFENTKEGDCTQNLPVNIRVSYLIDPWFVRKLWGFNYYKAQL